MPAIFFLYWNAGMLLPSFCPSPQNEKGSKILFTEIKTLKKKSIKPTLDDLLKNNLPL